MGNPFPYRTISGPEIGNSRRNKDTRTQHDQDKMEGIHWLNMKIFYEMS